MPEEVGSGKGATVADEPGGWRFRLRAIPPRLLAGLPVVELEDVLGCGGVVILCKAQEEELRERVEEEVVEEVVNR